MGEVVTLSFTRKTTDGGKRRIQARRRIVFQQEPVDDLVMLRPDVDTSPCEANPA